MAAKRVLYKVEYIFRASPTIVYQFLTTPACLVRWFCDEVDISSNTYTFSWDGDEQIAELIEDWEDELLRFEWEDAPNPNEYLEFRIAKSPVTDETVLTITDFCDANEVTEARKLWDSQIAQMRVETGG
ncbi:MAG: activator of HSP90 ATPase 1 family protein [Saprospiraceae bacterium]|nr:activator of HSP90 ATPase 1 family protein [Saprospiraceae bacterium]